MYKRINLLILVGITSTLAACGFHLRGDIGLADEEKIMTVESRQGNTPLTLSLRQSLQLAGVTVTDKASEAAYRIILLEQSSTSRNVSLSDNARSAEKFLKIGARFEVRNKDGKVVLNSEKVSASRIYLNQVNNVAATEAEQTIIRKELEQKLVDQIMRRIWALSTTNRPAPDQPASDAGQTDAS
jgi:LPS-assembly lipoprotein